MPGGDRTGPMGMGGLTGRAAGYCGGFGVPGYANPVPRRGFGMGFWGGLRGGRFGGGGRGWRNMFYATGLPRSMRGGVYGVPYPGTDPEMEMQALKNQAQILKSELDFIEKRLAEIKAEAAEQQA